MTVFQFIYFQLIDLLVFHRPLFRLCAELLGFRTGSLESAASLQPSSDNELSDMTTVHNIYTVRQSHKHNTIIDTNLCNQTNTIQFKDHKLGKNLTTHFQCMTVVGYPQSSGDIQQKKKGKG